MSPKYGRENLGKNDVWNQHENQEEKENNLIHCLIVVASLSKVAIAQRRKDSFVVVVIFI